MSDDTKVTITGPDGSELETTTGDMKRAADAIGHNSGAKPDIYRVTADELRQLIERFERLDAEKRDLADGQKEVMAEAKARGYCIRTLKKIISLRKRDPDDIAEEEAILEMYRSALGM